MVNILTKRMNSDSKLYRECPTGPCTNHPAHLGALGSRDMELIIIAYLTGLHAQGTMRGYKYRARGLQSYFLITSFWNLLSFRTLKNALQIRVKNVNWGGIF